MHAAHRCHANGHPPANGTAVCPSAADAAAARCWRHAAPSPPAAAARQPASEADAWELKQQVGARAESVSVRQTALGRGLVATADVPAAQPLLAVPTVNSLIIADAPLDGISIYSDRSMRRWQQQHGAMPEQLVDFLQGAARWDVRMTAWLLWVAQHPSPLWRKYCQLLPRGQDVTCLLAFDRDALAELQLPGLQREAETQAAWARYIHDKFISAKGGDLAALSLSGSAAHTTWAVGMVRSRTFSEDVDGELLTLMVPLADLANHADANTCTFGLDAQQSSFQLRSLRPLAAGEELTVSYGQGKPNCELIRDYGFLVPGNVWDRLPILQDDTLRCLNPVDVLEAAGFTGDLAAGSIQPTSPPPPHQALQWRRRQAALLSLPVVQGGAGAGGGGGSWLDDLARPWTQSGQAPAAPLQRREVHQERAAVAALQQRVVDALQALPTGISCDEELLRQHQEEEEQQQQQRRGGGGGGGGGAAASPALLTPCRRAAVEVRLEHKLVLKEALAVLMAYEQRLASLEGLKDL